MVAPVLEWKNIKAFMRDMSLPDQAEGRGLHSGRYMGDE